MSKKAIIFHGTDGTPADFWYQWLSDQLQEAGYAVEVPSYPEINHEPIDIFLPKVLSSHTFDEETILIGHSAGATLILSILENIEAPIPKAFLVASFVKPLPDGENPILQKSYDWEKIKTQVADIYFVNSVNDPWGCNDVQGRYMFDKLGGTQVIRNEGHFGSSTNTQPYPTFPLLRGMILQ